MHVRTLGCVQCVGILWTWTACGHEEFVARVAVTCMYTRQIPSEARHILKQQLPACIRRCTPPSSEREVHAHTPLAVVHRHGGFRSRVCCGYASPLALASARRRLCRRRRGRGRRAGRRGRPRCCCCRRRCCCCCCGGLSCGRRRTRGLGVGQRGGWRPGRSPWWRRCAHRHVRRHLRVT
jgi:hypothetical protein